MKRLGVTSAVQGAADGLKALDPTRPIREADLIDRVEKSASLIGR
jgi:hypothetical protein